jgi:hypothetical protein
MCPSLAQTHLYHKYTASGQETDAALQIGNTHHGEAAVLDLLGGVGLGVQANGVEGVEVQEAGLQHIDTMSATLMCLIINFSSFPPLGEPHVLRTAHLCAKHTITIATMSSLPLG